MAEESSARESTDAEARPLPARAKSVIPAGAMTGTFLSDLPHPDSAGPAHGAKPLLDAMTDWTPALKRLGYDSFRPGQHEAIETLLLQRRLLLIAPTGGGKSLVYQLPASVLPGTTVVVSPLISLMNDQVTALNQRGIPATYLASTLNSEELSQRMARARNGAYKLVYVAPERLTFGGFRALLERLQCPLVVIDEAHCISEWGHDFRPEYLQIRSVITALPRARVLACTATATPIVRDEILARLGLGADTPQVIRGFARPNLVLRAQEVSGPKEGERATDALLREVLGAPLSRPGCAIIYAPTRRKAEKESERLKARGWRAGAYHAGMEPALRAKVQARFTERDLQVVCATNAFGMGIDRSDVRVVIHLAPPGSVEAYYQEVGRAGRDGETAVGLMLSTAQDMALRRRLLEQDSNGAAPDPSVVEHKWNLFLELMRWAEGGSCRHDAILRYFGTEDIDAGGCGRCDVCTELASADAPSAEETELLVRKALSGVARVHGRFGLTMAAKLLKGDPDKKLLAAGLRQVSTFGVLADYDEVWLVKLLRRCITAGWADFSGHEHPTVLLTPEGVSVMKGQLPARLLIPSTNTTRQPGRGERPAPSKRTRTEPDLDATAQRLFDALRAHRLDVAREQQVPPYVVASDRTLRELSVLRPKTERDLQLVHGIGPNKLERYGAGLIAVIRDFV